MIVSTVNFSDQLWHLSALLIALVQPLLFLSLIIGFILASAHLLTMIGTRWGDRRTNSKALLFSLGIHALLAFGLVAMIPEYDQTIAARVSHFDERPIEIKKLLDRSDMEAIRSEDGNTPIWEQIDPSQPPEWARFAAPEVDLSNIDQALDRPTEEFDFDPLLASDNQPLPSESLPVPEQELKAEEGELEEASIELNPEMLATVTQSEERSFSAVESRLERNTLDLTGDEETLSRPNQGSVDRINTEQTADRQQMNLATTESGIAPLIHAPADEIIQRSQGPVPISSDAQLLGQERAGEATPSILAASPSPSIERSRPQTEFPVDESVAIERYRPRDNPTLPDQFSPEVESSVRGNDQLLPIPDERPQMVLPNENLIARVERRNVPSAYLLRTEKLRERAILKYGGSEKSEAAVDLSLKWLAKMQHPDGYWDASESGAGQVGIDDEGIDRQFAGKYADTGVTALAVLAFLGKMNTVDEGEYSPQVNKALRWLISQQRPRTWSNGDQTSGYLGGEATQFAGMYCHGMATFALAEAYALSSNREQAAFLREPLEQAINYILVTQISDGGWRYLKGQPDGDMSMFGWQLMALKSAQAAGIEIPAETKNRMIKFLRDRRLGRYGGLAGYRSGEPPTPPMTAEAFFCRQVLEIDDDPSASDEAARYLLSHRPSRSPINLYYWYYGTLAMYQHGGEDWVLWNDALRDLLISEQRTIGPQAGSWDPRGVWGRYGGRIYSTAIATLSLEVYYRYLREE